MKKICVATGSRADYGLLRWVIKGISESKLLNLQIIATGSHLSPTHGHTVDEIISDGFLPSKTVEMLVNSDTTVGTTKSFGLAMVGLADALSDLKPDLVLLLGDRYEALATATASLFAGVPIAHIHGGETTEGAFDEAIRHSITKMSHLHFVAAEAYRQRVIQLGEHPDTVHTVGGLGIDAMSKLKLIPRKQLESDLKISFAPLNLLVTYHPETLANNDNDDFRIILRALEGITGANIFFTMPNADPAANKIRLQIQEFAKTRGNVFVFESLGQIRYLSLLKQVDAVVGNSSSGILEAPSFCISTVNIGDRQRGRLRAKSIIDCAPDLEELKKAINKAISIEYRELIVDTINPYGTGDASSKIVSHLETLETGGLRRKRFYDLLHSS
jgi:GDP/UDP-N,N'-diacetylbacillosamine 2-epimerase (hydrolysing)